MVRLSMGARPVESVLFWLGLTDSRFDVEHSKL